MMSSSPGCEFTGVATICRALRCSALHLVEVAACSCRIDEHRLDLLVRPQHEHRTNGRVDDRRARTAARVRMDPVVRLRDLQLVVANQRIVDRVALRLRGVRNLPPMIAEGDR